MRNIFDQYNQPENKLTHSLVSCLYEDKQLLNSFLKSFCSDFFKKSSNLQIEQQTVPGELNLLDDENDRKGLVNGLVLTVFLGFIFTCFQAYEYHHATFTIDGNIYGSTFYMATGFHGFHVIVGTIFLAVCLFRSMRGHSNSEHHFGFEAAAWYWHFVDVVWLFLFAAIYIWGS